MQNGAGGVQSYADEFALVRDASPQPVCGNLSGHFFVACIFPYSKTHIYGKTQITDYGTDAIEEEVHRLGIGYITKPFELSRLVQIIHGLIRGEGTRDGPANAARILIPDPEGNVGVK